ncbi:aminotransferase class I/II-fold pyridoxal phosphate-dependent enzyme [Actinokineospora globicatena]|uniref:GntR family transcriptional regulator n=1 Tax=Actinokineospora globicatena TaxID=103729 RepID=A0A9W6QI78_9PSEU|nr:PLP-dependent aminotransferase family protein [Actinokineospora globicatena]GLW90521.1 GntR family transcriptional regulator [Actinokineospora globicatena]
MSHAAQAPVHWLVTRIRDRTARGIAVAVGELIRDGELPPGTRLPTVRALAAELAVSPATVADSWGQLRAEQLINTGRRRGTTTLAPPDSTPHDCFPGWSAIDLEQGLPDPALLPPLEDAVAAGVRTERLNGFEHDYITPRLQAAVTTTWPFTPEAWTVVAGGYEGTLLACQAVAAPGELVAVEEPTAPRVLDTLRRSGIRVIGVRCDHEGPIPAALTEALKRKPVAFIYQPRAHIPFGHTVSADRAAQLADVLEGHPDVSIVEDDNLGPLASAPVASIGAHLPERLLLVRSYCKAYGLELRSCVVAGAEHLVEQVRHKRGFGLVWASRILQDAQAYLINDAATGVLLRQARERYAHRRATLAAALRDRGFDVHSRDGLVLWVPVPDETRAMVALAGAGVTVAAGSRCYIDPPAEHHIRIATSHLPDDPRRVADLADLVARAAATAPRDEFD